MTPTPSRYAQCEIKFDCCGYVVILLFLCTPLDQTRHRDTRIRWQRCLQRIGLALEEARQQSEKVHRRPDKRDANSIEAKAQTAGEDCRPEEEKRGGE